MLNSYLWALVFALHREMGRPGNPYCHVEEEQPDTQGPRIDPGIKVAGRTDFWASKTTFLKIFIHKIKTKLVALLHKFYKYQNPILPHKCNLSDVNNN